MSQTIPTRTDTTNALIKEGQAQIALAKEKAADLAWVENTPPQLAEPGFFFYEGKCDGRAISVVGSELRGQYDGALVHGRTVVHFSPEDAKHFFMAAKVWLATQEKAAKAK